MNITETRPSPVTDALKRVAPGVSALLAVVSALGAFGTLNATQVAEANAYGGEVVAAAAPSGPITLTASAVIGLLVGAAHLWTTLKGGKAAEADTTPIRSPRDVDGTPLVRVDGAPLGGARPDPAPVTSGPVAYVDEPYAADPATETIRP